MVLVARIARTVLPLAFAFELGCGSSASSRPGTGDNPGAVGSSDSGGSSGQSSGASGPGPGGSGLGTSSGREAPSSSGASASDDGSVPVAGGVHADAARGRGRDLHRQLSRDYRRRGCARALRDFGQVGRWTEWRRDRVLPDVVSGPTGSRTVDLRLGPRLRNSRDHVCVPPDRARLAGIRRLRVQFVFERRHGGERRDRLDGGAEHDARQHLLRQAGHDEEIAAGGHSPTEFQLPYSRTPPPTRDSRRPSTSRVARWIRHTRPSPTCTVRRCTFAGRPNRGAIMVSRRATSRRPTARVTTRSPRCPSFMVRIPVQAIRDPMRSVGSPTSGLSPRGYAGT